MTEIFADGIRSIAVTNGVLRIELMQLKHNKQKNSLDPETAGTLLMPAHMLKDLTIQLANTLEKVQESGQRPAGTENESSSTH